MQEIDELVAVDSDVIALDCTYMKRANGKTINEFLKEIREKYPDIALMADISTFEEGINAWKCGVDIVGTTVEVTKHRSASPRRIGKVEVVFSFPAKGYTGEQKQALMDAAHGCPVKLSLHAETEQVFTFNWAD
jgi:hypothetical protein